MPNDTLAVQPSIFARSGEFWTLSFGGVTFSLKAIKGLAYLQFLLQHPGEEFHATDLVRGLGIEASSEHAIADAASPSSGLSVGGLGDAGEMLDQHAKQEYRGRLRELREELEELRGRGDHERGEKIEAEIDFIERELIRAVGLGGRDRRAGSAGERARLSVTRAIKSAVQKITEHHVALGELLEASIKTGLFTVYAPGPTNAIAWRYSLEETEPVRDRTDFPLVAPRLPIAPIGTFGEASVFVGRESESAMLRRYLDHAKRGAGGVVLIGGTAGVGKTRLAKEIADEAVRTGILAFVGNCYDREDPVPFMPIVEILEAALQCMPSREGFRALLGVDAPEISRLLPQLRRLFNDIPAPMELAPAQSQRLLFNAVGDLLARMAVNSPILLLLEDLHWADAGSLALFGHLARMVPRISVLMMGTYRDDEIAANSSLAQTLEELTRLHLIEQLSLRGLPQEAVAAIIRILGKREPTPAFVAQLHQTTNGNPFFVGELVRHLAERGELNDSERKVAIGIESIPLDLPQSLRLVLSRRLNRITDETRNVLATAATIGRSFPFALLEAATRADPEVLLDRVDEAEEAGLLTSTLQYPEARFHFVHELIRQAVRADLSALRQQRLHLQIADTIERLYPNTLEDWTDDLAHHLWEAGLAAAPERTLKWLKAAARRALVQGAHEAAIQYFRKALEVLKRLPQGPERQRQELRLNLSLTTPLTATRGYTAPEVEAACVRARELCQSLGDVPELFGVLGGLFSVYFNRQHFLVALELAEQLMSLARRSESRIELLWAHYTLGTTHQSLGDYTLARGNLERAVELYEYGTEYRFVQDPGATGRTFLAFVLFWLGYPDQALRLAQAAVALARKLSHPYTLSWVLGNAGVIHFWRGELHIGEELVAQGISLAQQHGFTALEALQNNSLGLALIEQNKIDAGLSRIQFSIDAFSYDPKREVAFERFRLASAYQRVGRLEEALAEVEKVQALTAPLGRHALDALLLQLRGELRLLQNKANTAEAERCFRAAIQIAQRQSAKMIELSATTELARLLAPRGRRDEARAMLGRIYNWFTEGFETRYLKEAQALLEVLRN